MANEAAEPAGEGRRARWARRLKAVRTHLDAKWGWWLLATLVLGGTMALLSPGGEHDIVSLELAGTAEAARAIVASFGDNADAHLRLVIVDYLWIVLYSATLYGACRSAGAKAQSATGRDLRYSMAWAAVLAGLFDMLENVGLIVMLSGDAASVGEFWAGWTTTFAWPKFTLVFFSVAFVLTLVLIALLRWIRQRLDGKVPAQVLRYLPQSLTPPEPIEPVRTQPMITATGKVGICCSGGGVRSASYNLGALQLLHEEGIFGRADYLAAVSGGSYMAGGITMADATADWDSLATVRDPFQPRSPEERHLRDHTTYVAPGFPGKMVALGNVLGGIVINVLLLVTAIVVLAKPIGWLVGSSHLYPLLETDFTIRDSTYLAIVVPLAIATIVNVATRVGRQQQSEETRHIKARLTSLLAYASIALFVVHIAVPGIPEVVDWANDEWIRDSGAEADVEESSTGLAALLASLGVGGMVAAGARALFAKRRSLFANIVASVLLPLLTLLLFVYVAVSAARHPPDGQLVGGGEWVTFAIPAFVLLVLLGASDVTSWSLHGFYKRRLGSAYAIRRRADGSVEPLLEADGDPLRFSSFQNAPGPELIVCAAANISDKGLTPPGRKAVPFTFTPSWVGMPEIAEIPTEVMEELLALGDRDEDVDVLASIAISGAAISPGMGKQTRSALTALLALMNLRLGVWLPNPYWVKSNLYEMRASEDGGWNDQPRGTYWFKEMLSMFRSTDRYLYVTDGGHWENLGLVELLRRGCTEIYCIDASGDDVTTFNTIGQALALARSELGVEVDINPEQMRPQVEEKEGGRKRRKALVSPTDHVVGSIRWPDGRTEGYVVLMKSAVTAETPADVRFYQESHPIFPNHSTLDQLFDGERFEAYRALGTFTARRAVQSLERRKAQTQDWEEGYRLMEELTSPAVGRENPAKEIENLRRAAGFSEVGKERWAKADAWAEVQRQALAEGRLTIDQLAKIQKLGYWTWEST